MEDQPSDLPLKVCRHCSVASRTEADECPSCGKPYARRPPSLRMQWSWWFAIPIVAAAFAIGYFGISKLIDGDGSDDATITVEQAGAVSPGATRDDLDDALDGEEPAFTRSPSGKPKQTCLYYGFEDQPDGVWEFCFADANDTLITSGPPGAGAQPAPAP